jgi:flagellar FliL protein
MADDKKSKDTGKETGGKGGLLANKKLLIMIVAPVLLLGGVGGFWFLGPGSGGEAAPEPGVVVTLDPITVNLASGHYLKFGLALQATKDTAEEPDGSKALDLAISTLSNRPMADLATEEKREAVKHVLEKKISHAYEGEVMGIYFTEFVME